MYCCTLLPVLQSDSERYEARDLDVRGALVALLYRPVTIKQEIMLLANSIGVLA